MSGYVYGGTQFDAHIPIIEKPKHTRKQANPAKCGTTGGLRKHRRDQTPICQPCRDAHNAYAREHKRAKRAGK